MSNQFDFDDNTVHITSLSHESGTKYYTAALLPCGTVFYNWGAHGKTGQFQSEKERYPEARALFSKKVRSKEGRGYNGLEESMTLNTFLNRDSVKGVNDGLKIRLRNVIQGYTNLGSTSVGQTPIGEIPPETEQDRREAYGDAFGAWS